MSVGDAEDLGRAVVGIGDGERMCVCWWCFSYRRMVVLVVSAVLTVL